ncbi:MAG: exodeoxyribonuclease VII large subunit, partial [Tepidisphaeraceae bacterium]
MAESFFDFQSRVTRPAAEPAESKSQRALSVADLTARIDAALRGGLPSAMLVRGEISNLNIHAASGHIYFTLKDAKSCVDCVMFRSDAARLKIRPTDGMDVLVTGSVKIYAQRGRYQFYATTLAPLGRGALELKFHQLKEKLEAEGMFAADRKRALPRYPQRIALVTSKQAAALQDMFKV